MTKPLSPTTAKLMHIRNTIAAGWCQHGYTDENGNNCIWAAIRLSQGLPATPIDEFQPPQLAHEGADPARRIIGEPASISVSSWNDAPNQTQDRVLHAIDKAITESIEETELAAVR